MKNLLKFAIALLAVITITSCKNSNTPEKVAESYLKAIAEKNYDEAKKLATEESAASIDMLKSMDTGKDAKDAKKEGKVEGMKCDVQGEKATCNYKQDGQDEKIELVKKGEKWLVEMKKESPMGDALNNVGDSLGKALGDSTAKK
ncbi:MAG: DUF4878 domain-containing protein [Bacteroidetes bacterium]|nr:DUF4878 domain-containing protein [Bacteroidota bacterium]